MVEHPKESERDFTFLRQHGSRSLDDTRHDARELVLQVGCLGFP